MFSTVTVYVTTSPTTRLLVLSADFSTDIAGAAATVVTVASSLAVTSVPLGSLPVAVAVLSNEPLLTSA